MDRPSPPRSFLRFFKWFCDPDLHPFIEGDLHELYHERVQELGKKKADRRFAWDVLLLFRPGIIRSISLIEHLINHSTMWRNYFKIGWRNLLKNRSFSLINISGMTIGMTCFILIALYIQYELSFDRHHTKADRIYRIYQQQKGNDFRGTDLFALAPMPLVPALKEKLPEVEAATTMQVSEVLFQRDDKVFYEEGVFADEHFMDVFDFPVVEGVGAVALSDPNAILLTETMARKYFGNKSPLGESLQFENDRPLTIRGVLADPPATQHFSFAYITSFQNYPFYRDDVGRWNSNNYRAYLVLPEGRDPQMLAGEINESLADELEAAFDGSSFALPKFMLQPLTDIHLHSHINFEIAANSDIRYIYLSASVGFIILLLAAINYMNLATARTSQRAKEVGMRKVLGAGRGQLVRQFMAESIIITLISFAVAVGLGALLLPEFNRLLDLRISFFHGHNRLLLTGVISLGIFFGLISGLYPALLASGVTPVQAFKTGWFKKQKDGALMRRVLVVGQFASAIILATASVVIYQQLHFIQNKKLGYNRDQVIYVSYQQQDVFDKTATVRRELLQHPQIDEATFAAYLPLNMISQGTVGKWEGNNGEQELPIYRNWVDYNFIDLFEIELLEGRNFSPDHPADSTESYILNEAAVKALGWGSAVGRSFDRGQVIGVVKDFHIQPFNLAIEPMYLRFRNGVSTYYNGNIVIKANDPEPTAAVAHLRKTLKTFLPTVPFEHRYMDESYRRLYQAEKRFGEVFNRFTFLALFIACIGLLGLVTHHVLQRTKEIGIRKVLGASVPGIVQLLSKEFLILVLISAVIAVPVAWWGMNRWLQDFAYRIDLNWWVFGLVGLLAIGLAFLTISVQAVRAATANPVESLKTE